MAYKPGGKNLKGHLRISQNSGNHNKYLPHNEDEILKDDFSGKLSKNVKL